MGYITPQGAANLANYKYSGVDQSILVRLFMGRFWNYLIDFVPRTIAPNLITACGISCVVLMYLINWNYCPNFEGSAPSWVYLLSGFMVFSYQTLDNLDGKQARRTGTSSPLGEVFDHGGDSMTLGFFAMVLGSTLQLGSVLTFVTMFGMLAIFYMAHWEAYFTGVFLMRPLDNPTEAQFGIIFIFVVTALAGPMFWLTELNIPFLGLMQINHLLFFFYIVGCVNTCLDNYSKVDEHFANLQMSMRSPLLCLAPLSTLLFFSGLSVWFAPSILSSNPRMFIMATGCHFSYLTIRLIVQNVCKEHFKPFYNISIPLLLVTFNCFLESLSSPIVEVEPMVFVYLAYHFVLLVYLVISVVTELSTILNIRVFNITPSSLP